MNIRIARRLALALLTGALFALAACGGGGSSGDRSAGKWDQMNWDEKNWQ
jgi:hypothetical protein